MTANNCDRCRFGDNGSNPEGCPETCFEPDYPDFDQEPTGAQTFDRSREIAGGLLALETENAQLKREVERLRGELEIVSVGARESIDDMRDERDQAYKWLRAWQLWALKLLRSWGRYQELELPGDHGARDEIAAEVTRLRESEAKAWGLVEEILMRDAIQINSGRYSDRCALTKSLRDARAALAARNAGS